MKKIWLLMLMVCTMGVFTACSDDDNGDKTPVNPITNCSVPSTAEIGTEVTVRGEGFDATVAKLILKDSENKETVIQNPSFTSSGAIFSIPMSLNEGKYTVILNQNGTWELGKITLTPASLPVTDLNIAEVGGIGKSLTIGGNGFNQTAEVYLENESGTRTQLTVTDRSSGLTCTVPTTAAKGDYKLILKQNGGEWTLTDKITLTVVKRLKSVKQRSESTMSGEGMIMTGVTEIGWEIRNSNQQISAFAQTMYMSQKVVDEESGEVLQEDEGDMESVYNVSIVGNKYSFVNAPENEGAFDPFNLTLTDGIVTSSSIERSNGHSGDYTWKYDNGYFQGLFNVTSGNAYLTYVYNGNNITGYNDMEFFIYGDKELKNNPFGTDVVVCYLGLIDAIEPFQLVAHMLDLCDKKSVNLPSAVNSSNPNTGEDVVLSFTYEYDADGYVTSMDYGIEETGGLMKILFEYESEE